ncbi:MAG: stress response translation initiation inhibitor YciH [Saccharospirillaceae bacterium]|nr:translation initiation factor [Pseudomonadales bacterium]NRB78110.1 stress response translation initiation inhibitor YciH [Saccharospirillaceae bacterium]
MSKKETRLVYSTEIGRVEEEPEEVILEGDGKALVQKSTKGRGGKVVTTISGLHLDKSQMAKLCKTLKKRCGTGGSVKDGIIEIQGEWIELLKAELRKNGHVVKGK